MDESGFKDLIAPRSLVAIKLHFGEKGNTAFIRPVFIRRIVDRVKELGGIPFLTDTNTLYAGTRGNSVSHLTTAIENGFAYSVVNAPIIIADGMRGASCSRVPVNRKIVKTAYVGKEIVEGLEDLEDVQDVFTNKECEFGYRTSRFKGRDQGAYIITKVTFRLVKDGTAEVRYPQLIETLGDTLATLPPGAEQLAAVRKVVLDLRRAKGMVIDESDPNTRSCGSFFLNVVLSAPELATLKKTAQQSGIGEPPVYPMDDGAFKVPSAWLVEQAGFTKGYRRGGVGISTKHALALINITGSSEELVSLKDKIQLQVQETFGITLVPEPIILPAS